MGEHLLRTKTHPEEIAALGVLRENSEAGDPICLGEHGTRPKECTALATFREGYPLFVRVIRFS
jgi:hypothetical protein